MLSQRQWIAHFANISLMLCASLRIRQMSDTVKITGCSICASLFRRSCADLYISGFHSGFTFLISHFSKSFMVNGNFFSLTLMLILAHPSFLIFWWRNSHSWWKDGFDILCTVSDLCLMTALWPTHCTYRSFIAASCASRAERTATVINSYLK